MRAGIVRIAADWEEGYAVTADHSVQQYAALGFVVSPCACCGLLRAWGHCRHQLLFLRWRLRLRLCLRGACACQLGQQAAVLTPSLLCLQTRFSRVACDLSFDSWGTAWFISWTGTSCNGVFYFNNATGTATQVQALGSREHGRWRLLCSAPAKTAGTQALPAGLLGPCAAVECGRARQQRQS